MRRIRRRRCQSCGELFRADPRNRKRQRYCAKPGCRAHSKAASQRRWLEKPENRGYFSGPAHVDRVRKWRAARLDEVQHLSRGRKRIQDSSRFHATEAQGETLSSALQDLIRTQPLILIGLIAEVIGTRRQDVILGSIHDLIQIAQEVMDGRWGT